MSKSILDKSFRYVPAASTNLKLTFARVRREQKEASERQAEKIKVLRKSG